MRWRRSQNRAQVLEGPELDSEPKGTTASEPGPFPGERSPRGCRPPVCSLWRPSVGLGVYGRPCPSPSVPHPSLHAQATPGRPAKSGDQGSPLGTGSHRRPCASSSQTDKPETHSPEEQQTVTSFFVIFID